MFQGAVGQQHFVADGGIHLRLADGNHRNENGGSEEFSQSDYKQNRSAALAEWQQAKA